MSTTLPSIVPDASKRIGIGASEIAAIAGIAVTRHGRVLKTPFDAYVTIRERALTGKAFDEADEGTPLEAGHVVEPALAKFAETKRLRPEFQDVEVVTSPTLSHPEEPWCLATPDRLVYASRDGDRVLVCGLECKLVGPGMVEDWSDGPPLYVLAQVTQSMSVLGAKRWDIVALVGNRVQYHEIAYDRDFGEGLLGIGKDFWTRHVVPGVPPTPGEGDDVSRLYPESDPNEWVEPTDEIRKLVRDLVEAREAKEAAQAAEERVQGTVKMAIGTKSGIRGLVTWRRGADRKETDWKAVADWASTKIDREAFAAILAAHTHTKPGVRTFRPNWKEITR